MINLREDINSLSNFKRDTTQFLEKLRKTRKPIVLTINGKAELVVQDAESYQQLLELAERLETIEALKPAVAEMKAGAGEAAETVFARLLQTAPKPE